MTDRKRLNYIEKKGNLRDVKPEDREDAQGRFLDFIISYCKENEVDLKEILRELHKKGKK